MDLQCHPQDFKAPGSANFTKAMIDDIHKQFDIALQPETEHFNPIPAAACLIDSLGAAARLTGEIAHLLAVAKRYLMSQVLRILT